MSWPSIWPASTSPRAWSCSARHRRRPRCSGRRSGGSRKQAKATLGSSVPRRWYYWYCLDREFGPFFLKFASYFPYNAKLCLNGHEYAKCQLRREGIGFKALDNGFVSCENPERLQTICEEMGPQHIDGLLRRWLSRLPHPFSAQDREAGYRYDISILQAEFSLTQVLDRPLHGRILFVEIIRENLREREFSLTARAVVSVTI